MNEYEVIKTVAPMINSIASSGLVLVLEDAKKYTAVLGMCGVLLNGILTLVQPKKPGVEVEFQKIAMQLTKISRQMESSFNNLSHLLVGNSFYLDVILKVDNLDRIIAEVFTTGSNILLQEFKNECKKHSPRSLISEVRGRLDYESTNPVITAVNNEKLNSEEIFNDWKNIVNSLTTRLFVLSSIYDGMTLYDNKKEYKISEQSLLTSVEHINNRMKDLLNNYEIKYWPDTVQQLIEHTVKNNTHVGNEAKAVLFQKALRKIHTKDQFYIMVYNDCAGYDNHSYVYDSDQATMLFRQGKCNVCIYRSRTAHALSEAKYKEFAKRVEFASRHSVYCTRDGMDARRIFNCFSDAGMVGLIGESNNVAIRWTGNHAWGPGWWLTADCYCSYPKYYYPEPPSFLQKVKIIIGYK